MSNKVINRLAEGFDEAFGGTESAILDIEEWQWYLPDHRVAIIRLIDFNDDGVMITERNLGSEENLEKVADLIANDEHDGLCQVIRKVFKP